MIQKKKWKVPEIHFLADGDGRIDAKASKNFHEAQFTRQAPAPGGKFHLYITPGFKFTSTPHKLTDFVS